MKDKFYRDMTDYQLKVVLKEITKNLEVEPDSKGMQEELALCVNVMKERGLLEDDTFSNTLSEKLDLVRGYVEFGNESIVKSEEKVEYKVSHGGKREGAGRPALGTTKKVSITLPDEIWEQIDEVRGEEALSAFLRKAIINGKLDLRGK